MKNGFIYVFCGGVGILVTDFIFSFFPFHALSNTTCEYILSLISILLGVVFSIFGIFYKKDSLLEMFFRFVAMYLSYFIICIFCGYTGITSFLLDVLHVNMSSMQDNVSGMLTVTFLIIIIFVDILIMVIESIRTLIKRKVNLQE